MNQYQPADRQQSVQRFEQARRQATRKKIAARLTGDEIELLPFEVIRTKLRQQNPMYRGIQEIPLDRIAGSVGRYADFTREFLPLSDSIRERWVNISTLASAQGWLPIELYQVNNVFFVRDGNHRVSVARKMGISTIEAHVWEFPEEVEIQPEDSLSEVLIRLGERRFMEQTGLAQRVPDHNIHFTAPGRYGELLAQIEELRAKLAQIDGESLDDETAVDAWYEMLYLPTVQIIRDSTLLDDFPGRTEADLFVWLSKHREHLRQVYGDYENLSELAQMLAERYKEGSIDRLARQVRRLLGSDELPPLEGLDPEVLTDQE